MMVTKKVTKPKAKLVVPEPKVLTEVAEEQLQDDPPWEETPKEEKVETKAPKNAISFAELKARMGGNAEPSFLTRFMETK